MASWCSTLASFYQTSPEHETLLRTYTQWVCLLISGSRHRHLLGRLGPAGTSDVVFFWGDKCIGDIWERGRKPALQISNVGGRNGQTDINAFLGEVVVGAHHYSGSSCTQTPSLFPRDRPSGPSPRACWLPWKWLYFLHKWSCWWGRMLGQSTATS